MYRRCDPTWLPSGRRSICTDIPTRGSRLCSNCRRSSPPPPDPDMDCTLHIVRHLRGRRGQSFPRRDATHLSVQRPVHWEGTTGELRFGCICRYHPSGFGPLSAGCLAFDHHIDIELCRCQFTGARNELHEGINAVIPLKNMSLTTTSRSRVQRNSIPLTSESCLVSQKLIRLWCSHERSP